MSHSVYIPVHFPLLPARLSLLTLSSPAYCQFLVPCLLSWTFLPVPCRILIDSLVLDSLPVILDSDSLPTPYWTCLLPVTDILVLTPACLLNKLCVVDCYLSRRAFGPTSLL